MPKKGQGKAVPWLREHVTYQGDDCLIWPFGTDGRGYGQFGHEGQMYKAHSFMCGLIHGPRPEAHEAAHSCGRGDHGCVHPKHLDWKTRGANQGDRRKHRTQGRGGRQKLTPDKVSEIRRLQGEVTVTALAERFKVTRSTIRQVHLRKTWPIDGQITPKGFAVTHPRRRELTGSKEEKP